jgi:hypothetical protein
LWFITEDNALTMNPTPITTIDQVIAELDLIISNSVKNNDPAGYFAALYRKVTAKVKEGIVTGYFDNGSRMEQLDVVFANRYLDALAGFSNNLPITLSWQKTFDLLSDKKPIVLQHLLMGMNAHINLDLGIAAAEISKGQDIAELQNDFNRINEILSSLVHEVEEDLSVVWPALKLILKHTGKIDDYLVDFSMKLARDGAWKFATEFSGLQEESHQTAIFDRDIKVAAKTDLILKPGWIASFALWLIRITEKGSVSSKIKTMC